MKKKSKISLGLIFILLILICATVLFVKTKINKKTVFKTEKISQGDVTQSVTTTGTVNPVVDVLVGTRVSGTITKIYVDFNSVVKKNQVIAIVDPAPFQIALEQANASLLQAQANLASAQASFANAQLTMGEDQQLYKNNYIAKSDLDAATTTYNTTKANVLAAQAQVSQTQEGVNNAKLNLGYTQVMSPVNGTVVSRNVDVGQTVAASLQTPTLFTIAQDLTKMQIDTNVDESDMGNIKTGEEVDFTVDAYPDTIMKGKVAQVRISPTIIQNVVTYDVVINVNNSDLKLKPGMTANASIITATEKNVLKIPNVALILKMPNDAKNQKHKGTGVWILKDNKPQWVQVSLGISDGTYTEVLSGDIKAGNDAITEVTAKTKTSSSQLGGPRMF